MLDYTIAKIIITLAGSFLGNFLIFYSTQPLAKIIYGKAYLQTKDYELVVTSKVLGIIERVLYVIALLIGQGEFIVVWIGFKVFGGWKMWEGDRETKDPSPIDSQQAGRHPLARAKFNLTLIRNALSILLSFTIYKIIKSF